MISFIIKKNKSLAVILVGFFKIITLHLKYSHLHNSQLAITSKEKGSLVFMHK